MLRERSPLAAAEPAVRPELILTDPDEVDCEAPDVIETAPPCPLLILSPAWREREPPAPLDDLPAATRTSPASDVLPPPPICTIAPSFTAPFPASSKMLPLAKVEFPLRIATSPLPAREDELSKVTSPLTVRSLAPLRNINAPPTSCRLAPAIMLALAPALAAGLGPTITHPRLCGKVSKVSGGVRGCPSG